MNVSAPDGLGPAGLRLWADVADSWELSAADTELLEQAARCADHLARLTDLAAVCEPITVGRLGQVLAHPIYAELRAERRTLIQLLGALDFADAGAESAPRARPRIVA